jgi:hypothetical protein
MAARRVLKSGIAPDLSQPSAAASAVRGVDAAMLHRVAGQAGRELPAATVRQDPGKIVLVNIKIREVSAVAIAQAAKARGVTQKQLVCTALQAAGVELHPFDLEDRTPPRRAA